MIVSLYLLSRVDTIYELTLLFDNGCAIVRGLELTEEGFHWLGDYEITADELLGGITPKANKKERAKQLIYELAETNSVVKSEDIVNLAEEKGISKRTLENAKKELGIKGKRIGESWYWKLDEIVKP